MNVDDKPSRRTARALMEGNARHATRARDGILRYFGIVLRLSRRNLSEVRPQLYRLRTLHAHTGAQDAHSADLESFFDVLRPHDDELGCMDVIFEHLAAGSQQDQSHRGDFLSSGYENCTVNMFEVLALLTIVRHGSLQKKLQMLHELFETSQYCKAGTYFQHDVYHPSQLLGNQPLAEDEVAFMIVSISRALALSGISSAASYYSVRRSVAGAVEASGGHSMEDGDNKNGRVTAAQLLVWAHTDPAPLALQEMLAMAPRLERMLQRFNGLLRTAEHATGHLESTPMRTKVHGSDDGARLTSIEARVSIGPVVLHSTESSATVLLQTDSSCVLTCRVRPRHRPPPGPPPEMKDDITQEVESDDAGDDQSLGSVASEQIGSQWGGEDAGEDASNSMFGLSTLQRGEPSVDETIRTGAYEAPAAAGSVAAGSVGGSLGSPGLQQHSSVLSATAGASFLEEGSYLDGDSASVMTPLLEHDAIDIEQSCRAGETAIFTVPGLDASKQYIIRFLQKDCHGADPCIAVLPFSTRAASIQADELLLEGVEATAKESYGKVGAAVAPPKDDGDDDAPPPPPLAVEYGVRRRPRENDGAEPLTLSLGHGIGLKRMVKKWLKVLQRCSDCSAHLSPMERREVIKTASRGAVDDFHLVALNTLLDNQPDRKHNLPVTARTAHCHLSLSMVPRLRHILPATVAAVDPLVVDQLQTLLNTVYEEVWLAMRGGYDSSASTPTLRDLTSYTNDREYVIVPAVDWHADLGGSRSGGKAKKSSQSSANGGNTGIGASSRLSAWSRRQAYLLELESLLETLTPERAGSRCCLVLIAPRPIIPADMHIAPSNASPSPDAKPDDGASVLAPEGGIRVAGGTTFTTEVGARGQQVYIGTASVERSDREQPAVARSRPLPKSKFDGLDLDASEEVDIPSRHAKGFELQREDETAAELERREAKAAEEKAKSGASNLEQIAFLREAPQRAAEEMAKQEDQILEKLLLMLSAWRTSHTGREVVVLCGGCDNSVVSRAKNTLTGQVIVQHSFGIAQQGGRGKKRALPERNELGVFQVEHKATVVKIPAPSTDDTPKESSSSSDSRRRGRRGGGDESKDVVETVEQIGDTLIVTPLGLGESMAVSVESKVSLAAMLAKQKEDAKKQAAKQAAKAEKEAAKAEKEAAKAAKEGDDVKRAKGKLVAGGEAATGDDTNETKQARSDQLSSSWLPKIKVGPIVGKVTDKMAVVLLEMDRACTITAIAIDCCSGVRHEYCCKFEVGRARTFKFDGLVADTPHIVFFTEIADPEDTSHVATFRTLDSSPTALNLHVLFREKFKASQGDNISNWEWLHEDAMSIRPRAQLNLVFIADIISDTTLSEVQTMVHLFMKDDDEDDHAQFLRAKDWLREKFELALTEPRLRRVLAHAPTLMMPGCWRLNNKVMQEYGSQCGCIMEALFDDVVSEFQAQLWGQSDSRLARPSYLNPSASDEHSFVPPMLNAHQRFFRHGSTGILTLTCMPQEPQMKNQHHHGARACNDTFVYRFGTEQLSALRTLLVETLRDRASGEEGGDGGGGGGGGGSESGSALNPIRLLVVACELPVLTNNEAYHCHKKEVHVLLTLLFQWKQKRPGQRRFVIICAGGVAPCETYIFDGNTASWDAQLILPPMVVPNSALAEAAAEGRPLVDGANDHFRWVHRRFEGINHGYTALSLVSSPHLPVLPQVGKLIMSSALPAAVALFGPFIGEVSETSARIILEVETTSPIDITCTVRSSRDGKTYTMTRVALSQVPLFFEFEELEPETNYDVSFSPLRDAEKHTGWFRTMSFVPSVLKLCFITGSDPLGQIGMSRSPNEHPEAKFLKHAMTEQSMHHPHLVQASVEAVGDAVLKRQFAWNHVFRRSQLPERAHDIVIHLGGFMRGETMRGAFLDEEDGSVPAADLATTLSSASQPSQSQPKRPNKGGPFAGIPGSGVLKMIETGADELVQRLRDAYRCAYGAVGHRDMIRGGSHLLFMHDDELQGLMRFSAGRLQNIPAIDRHMTYTTAEYKGRLGDPTYLKRSKDDDAEAAEGAEANADNDADEGKEKEPTPPTPTAADAAHGAPNPVSYHQRGAVGILSIWFTSSDRSKMWTCGNAVFQSLKRVLRKKELTTVVICTHIPLVPQRMQYIESMREGGGTKEQPLIPFSTVEPDVSKQLFEQLFEWVGNTRQVDGSFRKNASIVSGTFQAGCVTRLRDNKTGAVITQLCTGRPSSSFKGMELVPYGNVGERFSYTHTLPLDPAVLTVDSWPYAELQILTEPSKSTVVPSLCPTREQATGLQVVVGPILGPLTEQLANSGNAAELSLELQPGGPTTAGESTFSISVLVEFNQDAAIECTLSEVFTHEVQTHTIEMKAGEPRAFRLGGLGGERRFRISFRGQAAYMTGFERIEGAETVFITPAPQECEFMCALVSGDDVSNMGTYREKNPWENLIEYGEAYASRLGLIVHLGGQVGDLQPLVYEMLAYMRRRRPIEDAAEDRALEEKVTNDDVLERFRRAYREAWNMPTKKKVLRGNQHLMLCGELDIFKFHSEMERFCLTVRDTVETPEEALAMVRRVSRIARTAHREYQRQLWDPNWATIGSVPNETTFHTFRRNQVGIFFFDVHEEIPEGQKFTAAGDFVPKTEEEEEAERQVAMNEPEPPPVWEVQTAESGWTPYKAGPTQQRIEAEYQKGSATTWVDGEQFVSYTLDLKRLVERKDKSEDDPRKIRRNDGGYAARMAALAHAKETGGDEFAARTHTVSDEQWAMLKIAMDTPELMVLIVASEVPFVWDSDDVVHDESLTESAARQALHKANVEEGAGAVESPDNPATETSDKYCKAAWAYAPSQTKRLLKTLFDWKKMLPGREIVLAAGVGRGGYGGTDTVLTHWPEDGRLPEDIQQLTAGPITSSPDECAVSAESGKVHGEFEFVHVQQQQRNYGIISVQVGSDKYGGMSRVEGRILPFKAGGKSYRPRNDLLVPNWLKTRFPGDQIVYIEDEIWLRAKEDEGCNGVESFSEEPDFAAVCRDLYREFHLDDFPRPENLRFIDMSNPVTLRVFLLSACQKLWTTLPLHVQAATSDLSDPYVLEILFKKVMRNTAIFADPDAFAAFCKELVYTACILRLASLQTVTIEADEPEPVESDEEVEMEDPGLGPDGQPLSPMTSASQPFGGAEADGMSVLTGEGGDGTAGGDDADSDDDQEKAVKPVVKASAAAIEAMQAAQALQEQEEQAAREEEERRLAEEAAAAAAGSSLGGEGPMSPLDGPGDEGAFEEEKEYDSDGNEIDPNQNLMQEEMERLEDEDPDEYQRRQQDPRTRAAIKYPQEYRAMLKLAKRKDDFTEIIKRQKKQPVKLKQWSYDRLIDPALSDDDDMEDDDDEDAAAKKRKKKKKREKEKKKKEKKKKKDAADTEDEEGAAEGGDDGEAEAEA